MTLARSCAGRISLGAWRSRKYLLWTVALMASAFLVYVQFASSSSVNTLDNDLLQEQQQHRSLHSVQRQKRPQQPSQQAVRQPERVRFIGHNEEDQDSQFSQRGNAMLADGNDLEVRHAAASNILNVRENQILPEDGQPAAVPLPGGGLNPPEPNPVFTGQRENYIGNAAAAWNGGSFVYNPYGEPVYNHGNRPNYIPKERVVHFDLKGAPPIPAVYKSLIPWLAKNGATSILLEYEDMFPWEGSLAPLAAKNHYSKKEIEGILATCEHHGIRVIPLVQTFGHMEFALKLPKFSFLREVPEHPQALCPSRADSHWLVRTMIDQVMALHKGAQYLHIGCDEVFQMGECDQCRLKSRENLFLDHVSKTAKYAKNTYKVTPIIWHDMLDHISESAMIEYNFGELLEPMVWVYAEDIYRFVPPSKWKRFGQVFPTVWGASAFKGAFGEQSTVPNIRRHLDNNLNWLDVLASEEPNFSQGIKGLVLTGWQRHDHFAVLCELFPAALPSLAVNLISTTRGFFNATVHPVISDALDCMQTPNYQSDFNLNSDPFLWDKFSWCRFIGSSFFKITARLDSAKRDVNSYIDRVTQKRAWLSEYNRRHNFSSPMRIEEDLEELPSRIHTVTILLKSARVALKEWFDDWTTGEWIEQHIWWPMMNPLRTLEQEAMNMKSLKTWPARPLPLLPELQNYGIHEPKMFSKGGTVAIPQTVYEKRDSEENFR